MDTLNIQMIIEDVTEADVKKVNETGRAKKQRQIGLRYNNKNYYFKKPVECLSNISDLKVLYSWRHDLDDVQDNIKDIYIETNKALEDVIDDAKLEDGVTPYYLVDKDLINWSEIRNRDIKNNNKVSLGQKIKNLKASTKRIIAAGLATLCLGGAVAGCSIANKKTNNQIASSTNIENDYMGSIKDFQNDFNTRVANDAHMDEDKDAKLYMNIDEVIALWTYANANTLSPAEIANYFGNIDELSVSNLTNNYDNAAEQLIKAYYRNANPNVEKLFTDQDNANLYSEVEALYLACASDPSVTNKKALNDKFIEIFYEDNDIKEKHVEAAGIIGKVFVPLANINNLLSSELTTTEKGGKKIKDTLQDSINNINCNYLKEKMEEISALAQVAPEVPGMKDTINSLKVDGNRNINLAAGHTAVKNNNQVAVNNNANNQVVAPKTEEKKEEVTREEAVKEVGESTVQQKEEEAEKKANEENNTKNQEEAARVQGLKDVHNAIVEKATAMDSTTLLAAVTSDFEDILNSKINSYTGDYKRSYTDGAREGLITGINEVREMKKTLQSAIDEALKAQEAETQKATAESKEFVSQANNSNQLTNENPEDAINALLNSTEETNADSGIVRSK